MNSLKPIINKREKNAKSDSQASRKSRKRQHLTFMACLCERMAPNFALFCQMTEQKPADKTYHNILNLVWEFLTVKEAKINFENQLEKLEEIIPECE